MLKIFPCYVYPNAQQKLIPQGFVEPQNHRGPEKTLLVWLFLEYYKYDGISYVKMSSLCTKKVSHQIKMKIAIFFSYQKKINTCN